MHDAWECVIYLYLYSIERGFINHGRSCKGDFREHDELMGASAGGSRRSRKMRLEPQVSGLCRRLSARLDGMEVRGEDL